ncbi:MAG: YbdD/YjiX family protein [Pseudomonadota bacterium]
MLKLKQSCSTAWSVLRELSGDDAYERYLQHHSVTHPDEQPLDRATFFKTEQRRKWDGVRRCC